MSNLYDKPINELIPAGVTLTDIQKGYLEGVILAMKTFKKDHVSYMEVGVMMRKDKSEVSSGIRPLMKKGILDVNDDVEIVFAEKKPAAAAPKPSGTSAGKAKTGAKTTTAKKTSAGKDAKYNDQVSFALSREYEMAWDKDKDGNDVCKIVSVKRADGDIDNPETTVLVSVIENDDPNKDQFDIIQEGDDKSTFIPLDSDPEGLLCITYLDMQILSMNFRTSLYRLFIKLSSKETLLLFLTSTSSGGENKFFEDFTKLSEIWRFVRIDGEACNLGSAGEAGTFAKYMKELADNGGKPKKKAASVKKTSTSGVKADQKKKAETIIRTRAAKFPDASQYKGIHQVEDEPELISPIGTWSIPVPPGCSYTMDPDCAGGGFTGKYLLQIQTTEDRDFSRAYDSRFSIALFSSGVILKAFSSLIDLSIDEAGDEIVQFVSKADPRYEFFKRTASLAIMTKTENAAKNESAVMFLIFTRGKQYGAMGQIVVHGKTKKEAKEEIDRVLNSISVIAPPQGDEGVSPVVIGDQYALSYLEHKTLSIEGGVTLPIPDGFKASTDPNQIGAPRVFSIVPKDYPDYSKAMDAKIGITAVLIQGNTPEYRPQICDKVCGIITEQFEQQGIFIKNAPKVVAQKSTKGIIFYQRIFDNETFDSSVAKAILWTGNLGYIISFAVNFEEKIADHTDVGNDAERIMSDWMNRIVLPGEKLYYIPSEDESDLASDRIDNLISSPMPELLHEHFDLITNGGYTTHRDADFIGQSIRGLMEKCGTTGEAAYDEMKIAGDAYDLDKSALKLAQVFRLDESLFEPYKDREALIRLSVFSDVRMLHALRSLSWMVSRYSEKENCPVSKITFDELRKMGRVIEKKKYLNYDGSTGFINLCNHYDWHVFYVPEKYRDGSTAMKTDLRYLTGKENRGGNTMSVFIPGITDIGSMHRKNNIISRNEETLESLDALRKDLKDLLPVMETIHDGLLEDRDRSKALEGPLADALTAWCALAVAAKEPFYSEEAADTPEADAALEAPPERPTDKLDDKPVKKTGTGTKPASKKIPAKGKSSSSSQLSGKTETFYDRFTFVLPDGYVLEREEDDRCVFFLNEHDDGTGTLVYDYLNTMTIENFKDLKPGESPVQRIRNSLYFTKDWYEISKNPESGILTEQNLFYRKGEPVDTYSMMYVIRISDTGALVFREKVMEGRKHDVSFHLDKYEHFLQAIGNLCLDGKPVPPAGITAAELWEKVRAYRDEDYGAQAENSKTKEKSGIGSSGTEKSGTVVNGKGVKSSSAPKTGSTPVAKQKTEPVNNNVRILNVGGARVIEGTDYMADTDPRPMVIPEGVVRIDDSVFSHCHMESVTLPRTMRTLGHHVFSTCENLKKVELNEGLEEIDSFIVSDCPKMTEITLPDSIRKIDNDAFLAEFSVTNPVSHITVKLSGKLARYLVANNEYPDIPALRAREFVVDGERYKSLEEYVRRAPKQERNRTVSTGGNGASEEQKQHERNALINRITALEKERDSLGGLFAGLKRKKLQKEIDMLKEEIRRL